MSSTIRGIIRRIAPEFADVSAYPDATLDLWIADAQLDVPASKFGLNADRAVAYYTAHLMTQGSSSTSVSGGAVSKEKVGDVEITYSTSASASSGAGDKYYDMYLQLAKKLTRMGPIVLNGRA